MELDWPQAGRGLLETFKEGLVVGAPVVVEALDEAEIVPEDAVLLLALEAEAIVPEKLELEEGDSVDEAEEDGIEEGEPESDWVEELSED